MSIFVAEYNRIYIAESSGDAEDTWQDYLNAWKERNNKYLRKIIMNMTINNRFKQTLIQKAL